jgi:hypothetical protein
VKTSQSSAKGTHRHTQRQHGDFISIHLFLKKEIRQRRSVDMIEKKQRMLRTLHSSEKRKLLIAAFSITLIVEGNLFGSLVTMKPVLMDAAFFQTYNELLYW